MVLLARAIAVALLAVPQQSIGQPGPPFTIRERFDRRHGLSNGIVLHVIQDRTGFLWIGTMDGLNRFDGNRFTVFRHDPNDSSSLSNNTVRRILEDSHGNLWIRTEVGLDRLDRRTGRFRRYPLEPQAFLEGAPPERVLLADPRGLFRYMPERDEFELIVPFPLSSEARSPSRDDQVWGLAEVGDTIWLSTARGHLFALAPEGGVVHVSTSWQHPLLNHVDPAGRLWIGHNSGLAVFDPKTRRTVRTTATRMVRGAVLAIAADRAHLWVGGERLYRIESGDSATPMSIPLGEGEGEPLSSPLSILVDREGGLWLATRSGLRHGDPYAKEFGHLRHTPDDPQSLSGDAVMALVQTGDSTVWAGTLGAGLNRLDPATGRFRRYRLCGADVWSLHAAPGQGNHLWVGTNGGLCVLNPVTGQVTRVRFGTDSSAGPNPIVFALTADPIGRVWVGTAVGLFRVDSPKSQPVPLELPGQDRPGRVRVEGLAIARNQNLWVGTSGSDLYRIDLASGATTHYPLGDAPALRGSEGFWTISELADGRLLLGSDRGLFAFVPETGSLRAIGPAEGVPAGPVFAILPDRNAIWLSTGSGLLRHTRPEDLGGPSAASRFYTTSDGLPYSEFNRRAAVRLADGRFAFGGMGGITLVDPVRLRDNPHPPPVVLTSIERYRKTGSVVIEPYRLDTLRASHDDVGIGFQFAALTFTNPGSTTYAFRLDNFDRDWVPAGNQRIARYPALRPGRYTFQVRAANADGIWNQVGTGLTILVPPPWWATWWFRGTAGLLGFGGLAIGLRQVATRRLRRRVRELELEQRVRLERDRIARDLHDSVGSQVSTILTGLELLELNAQRGDQERARQYVEALKQDADHTLTLLRDTVWSLHQDRVSTEALAERIQEHLRDRQRYLPATTLRFALAGEFTASLASTHALHLFRIVQEAVTNAIRHATPRNVRVEMRTDPMGAVTLIVEDDGTRRIPDQGHHGHGLEGMRARARECGGTFEFDPSDSGGSVVRVTLPRPAGPP